MSRASRKGARTSARERGPSAQALTAPISGNGLFDDGLRLSPRCWGVAFIVAAIAFVAFLPALDCQFNYDDDEVILRNEQYRGLSWPNLKWMFSTFHMGHYQPLTWMSLGADYVVWGMNPRGYHLTNLLLHAANAGLVFIISMMLLRTAMRPTGEVSAGVANGVSNNDWGVWVGAFVTAVLFGVHPLRVESVVWVTERRDVLSSFWLFVVVGMYLHAQLGARPQRRRAWLIAAFVAYLFSLSSRAMGVTLPVVLLLLDYYPLRRIGGGIRWIGRETLGVLMEKVPFAVAALGFAIIAPLAQASVGATIPWSMHGPGQRLAQACYGLVFYVHKTLLPVCLSPLYELDVPIDPMAGKYLISAAIVAAALVVVCVLARRSPALLVAVAIYVVILAPVLGFVQSGRQEVADRYSYLPSISLFMLVGGLIAAWWRRPGQTAAAAGLAVVILLAGAVATLVTWRQCQVWKTPLSLWTHGTECQPGSYLSFYNLGSAQALAGDQKGAVASFTRGLELNPEHVKTRFNMANAFQELSRTDDALAEYGRVIEIDPADALSHYEIGRIQAARGRVDEATEAFRRALERRSDHVKSRVNLGAMLARKGDHVAALPYLEEAARQDPTLGDAQYNLAISLYAVGKTEEAVTAYRRAIELMPNFPDARVNLGNIFAKQARMEDARQAYEGALKVAPGHPAATANLAALRQRMGDSR